MLVRWWPCQDGAGYGARGDHHGLTGRHGFTGGAVCGADARLDTAWRGLRYRDAAEAVLEPAPPAARGVGWGFISLYALAYMSTSLLFIAPLLVTLHPMHVTLPPELYSWLMKMPPPFVRT